MREKKPYPLEIKESQLSGCSKGPHSEQVLISFSTILTAWIYLQASGEGFKELRCYTEYPM